MPDDTSTLHAQAALADVRLLVLNRERVPPEEFRSLLLDLMHSRDASAGANRSASAAKSRANKRSASATPTRTLADLFGPPKESPQ
jgi:hypothetical protein